MASPALRCASSIISDVRWAVRSHRATNWPSPFTGHAPRSRFGWSTPPAPPPQPPRAATGRQGRRAGGAGAAAPTGAPEAARGRADARNAAPGADADARACTRACTRADGDARACTRRSAVTRTRRGGGAGLDDSGASAARGARAGGVPRARSPSGDAVSTGLAHRGRGDAAARGAIAERASGGHTLDRSALKYLRTGADRSARSVRARDAARSVKA